MQFIVDQYFSRCFQKEKDNLTPIVTQLVSGRVRSKHISAFGSRMKLSITRAPRKVLERSRGLASRSRLARVNDYWWRSLPGCALRPGAARARPRPTAAQCTLHRARLLRRHLLHAHVRTAPRHGEGAIIGAAPLGTRQRRGRGGGRGEGGARKARGQNGVPGRACRKGRAWEGGGGLLRAPRRLTRAGFGE